MNLFALLYLEYLSKYGRESVCNHDELSEIWTASNYNMEVAVEMMLGRVGLMAIAPVSW